MTGPDYTEAELTAAREHLADDVLCGGTKPSLADCLTEGWHEELGAVVDRVTRSQTTSDLVDALMDLRALRARIVAAYFAHPDQEDAVRLRACELREEEA